MELTDAELKVAPMTPTPEQIAYALSFPSTCASLADVGSCPRCIAYNGITALGMARHAHRPHSLIQSQRTWQKLGSVAGIAAWGYAYESGQFNRKASA